MKHWISRLAAAALIACAPLTALAGSVSGVPGTLDFSVVNGSGLAGTSTNPLYFQCAGACVGGSSSDAVTSADCGLATIGCKGDTPWVSGSGTLDAILKAIANNTAAALPAGSNIVGKFGIDQTTPGTTNAVFVSNSTNPPAPLPNDTLQTCTITTATTCIVTTQGAGAVGIGVTGSGAGMSFTLNGTPDGSNYHTIYIISSTGAPVVPGTALTANGNWTACIAGQRDIEVSFSAISSGTATVALNSSAASCPPFLGPSGGTVVEGPTATTAAFAANPLPGGGRASSTEPTAATTTHPVANWNDLDGAQITRPYGSKAVHLRGSASTTGNTAVAVTNMGAQGAGVSIYVAAAQCSRNDAGTSEVHVTLNDSASTVISLPNMGGGGANNPVYPVPLFVAANTGLTYTPSASITTITCDFQGVAEN